MKIRTLIVDDEALARARIKRMIADDPDVEVLGECASGLETVAFIREQRPDLVFLDVQMPEMSGFDVLRALPADNWPIIIFVTAYEQHALKAFDVHALDYLLKPFKEARLRQALQRVRQQIQKRDSSGLDVRFQEWLASQEGSPRYPSRLTVKSGRHTVFIQVEDLDYIEAAANYAILHAGATSHILRETLMNLETKLSPKRFLRVSRSVIVNLDRVEAVRPASRGEHVVVLKGGREFPLTRGVREIQQRLECL